MLLTLQHSIKVHRDLALRHSIIGTLGKKMLRYSIGLHFDISAQYKSTLGYCTRTNYRIMLGH